MNRDLEDPDSRVFCEPPRFKATSYAQNLQQALAAMPGGLMPDNVAIVDTGATGHYLSRRLKSLLLRQREGEGSVRVASGGSVPIDTVGDFELQAVDSGGQALAPILLKDASVLRTSPFNLVSVGMLCDAGSVFHFEKGNSWFTCEGHRFPIEERDGLFLIHLDRVLKADEIAGLRKMQEDEGYGHEVFSSGTESYCCAATFSLWHERLGHASTGRLKFLYENGSAEGFNV